MMKLCTGAKYSPWNEVQRVGRYGSGENTIRIVIPQRIRRYIENDLGHEPADQVAWFAKTSSDKKSRASLPLITADAHVFSC